MSSGIDGGDVRVEGGGDDVSAGKKGRVCYYYDREVGNFYYGPNHPMKPHRLAMTHELVLAYGLHTQMSMFALRKATPTELAQFHTEDYVDFLGRVTPETQHEYVSLMQRFNLGEDCPVFDGLGDFVRLYSGGSIDGARRLNHGLTDVAINWSGGLHHAKKGEASGFCYVNDLVLAILELLKHHARVLYIDIDIHHGDGVEEAFYTTDRVMTVSFHKYGDMFFPGTGALGDVGANRGKRYSVNVPLRDGVDDRTFQSLFQPIMERVMEVYQPGAVVLQCGADSLGGDRLGCFSLSLDGHADCVRFMKKFRVPLLVTGGGGYTKHNVARCWAYETAAVLDAQISESIPMNAYMEYYAPEYRLGVASRWCIENANKVAYLNHVKKVVFDNLKDMEFAPSVQMHEVPPDWLVQLEPEVLKDGAATGQDLFGSGFAPPKRRRREDEREENMNNGVQHH